MKAEQRRIEEEARLERTATKKDTMAAALRDNKTLEGFDMETKFFHVTKLTNVAQELKESRLVERQALAELNNNDDGGEDKAKGEVIPVTDNADELDMNRTLESEELGWITPGPFEPAPEPKLATTGGAGRKAAVYPALDVRKTKREERLRRKAEVEDRIARMVTDSTMSVEVAMEFDRNGKNLFKQG